MAIVEGGALRMQTREKGAIVGKDAPRAGYRSLTPLADGRIVVGYAGPRIGDPRGLQVRALHSQECLAELPEAAPPHALHPDGRRLLAAGPLSGGYHASLQLIDLDTLAFGDFYPLRAPYCWLPDAPGVFIAQTPHPHGAAFIAPGDQGWRARHPYLEPLVAQHRRLVVVDLTMRTAQFVVDDLLGPEPEAEVQRLALAPDGQTLYVATYTAVAALALAKGRVLWQRPLGAPDGIPMFAIYALAVSGDGAWLAAGGIGTLGDGRQLSVLDTDTGDLALGLAPDRALRGSGLRAGTSIGALAWHPSGWLAVGTSGGIVMHIAQDGSLRAYAGASSGITALAFVDGGHTLLVASSERQFRAWPLE